MLSRLLIKNYALIDNLDIAFDGDLNIITGETGAGKSIIMGALGLILGQRAESKYFFNQQKKCVVEGFFNIKSYNFRDFFEENDLDYDEETVLRREIALDGKSRAFVNDTPVNLATLKALGQQLIDVHSQHATLEINDSNFQLLVLDVVAEHQPKVNEYKKAYQEFKKLQKKYVGLLEQTEKAKTDQDYFQFLFDELAAANIEIDEQETLEQELNSLTHAEEIKKNLYAASYLINGFENAVLPKLKEAIAQLQSIEKYETAVSPLAERLQSCNIEIKDIVAEVESLEQHTVFDALRTEEINERLGLLYALQKKHRVNSNAELLEIKHDLAARLNDILFADEDLLQLEKQLEASETALLKQATQISESRKKVIPKIEDHIVKTLAEVGMPTAQIKIEQNAIGKGKFDLNGIDQVRFLFNANKGHQLNELNKVASGGELSRLMLSIKSLIAQKTALPTIIFDEIDTGVSGEVANRVGLIMQELATAMQVIAITHLPQMASKGKAHYFVHKITKDNLTYTQIKRLTQEERVLEIAKMLSGENPKAAALQNARELLQN